MENFPALSQLASQREDINQKVASIKFTGLDYFLAKSEVQEPKVSLKPMLYPVLPPMICFRF